MLPLTAHVALPELREEGNGTLHSLRFNDLYCSREGGIAETHHVFLAGNGLPQRFQHKQRFVIGETGFGTGLNFIVAATEFLAQAPKHHHLHYISFEAYPLTPSMLVSHHRTLPSEYGAMRDALLTHYPLRVPGLHRVALGRVMLTLGIGDARALIKELGEGTVDAWFLDGFAPAKNPELWEDALLQDIAHTSAHGATLATYTAASAVRRSLTAAGFTLETRNGFGRKREMLVGRLAKAHHASTAKIAHKPIVIIGAGIAGAALADAFVRRSIPVTVLDAHTVASGASGNPVAALYPQITKRWNVAAAWHMAAFGYTRHWLQRLQENGKDVYFSLHGMAKLTTTAEEEEKFRQLETNLALDPAIARFMEAQSLSARLGVRVNHAGLWLEAAGFLAPRSVCETLVRQEGILLRENCQVNSLEANARSVALTLASGEVMNASMVILASAYDTARLLPGLPLQRTGGQVSFLRAPQLKLSHVLSHSGYVMPYADQYLIGATYDHADFSGDVTQANHEKNLESLHAHVPDLAALTITGGRSSVRAATRDRLPYVGAVSERLYLATGFGSRGMISAPFAAEMIAAELCGEPPLVQRVIRDAVQPSRAYTANTATSENPSRANTGA